MLFFAILLINEFASSIILLFGGKDMLHNIEYSSNILNYNIYYPCFELLHYNRIVVIRSMKKYLEI